MGSSMTFEEKFETLMKNFEYLEKQNEYLKKQLGECLKNKRSALHSKSNRSSKQLHEEEVDSQGNPFASFSEDDSEPRQRKGRRHHQKQYSFDIRIEILI